jgi:hypothetical protein
MEQIIDALRQVMASSSQLSAWALAIIGGSVAVIVGTSYRRPDALRWRIPYLLFLPGWACIGYSLYLGNKLVGSYLAAIMGRNQELISSIASQVNDMYAGQRIYLLLSLVFFGLWLLIYLLSWIFVEPFLKGDRK